MSLWMCGTEHFSVHPASRLAGQCAYVHHKHIVRGMAGLPQQSDALAKFGWAI